MSVMETSGQVVLVGASPETPTLAELLDPDYEIYKGLKSNAESMERLDRDLEKRRAKAAASAAEGLLVLLGDWEAGT